MDSTNCRICGLPLSSAQIVEVKRGMQKLFECSVAKNDGLFVDDGSLDQSVVVHVLCRNNYTKRVSAGQLSSFGFAQIFDFLTLCLFCNRKCVKDPKLVQSKLQDIHMVTSSDFKENIMLICSTRTDDNAMEVASRIKNVDDLVEAGCRYHGTCHRKFISFTAEKASPGRPSISNPGFTVAFEKLCDYINDNDTECQYNINQLMSIFNAGFSGSEQAFVDRRTLTKKIEERYKDNVRVQTVNGVATNFFFFLGDFGTSKISRLERVEIIRRAAEILRIEIRSFFYDCDVYPKLSTIAARHSLFPGMLNLFMDELVLKEKKTKNSERNERKIFAIMETIISAIRERSYVSPLLTNLGIHLHRSFDSKYLNNILECRGLCGTYKDVLNFETSACLAEDPKIKIGAFTQMVFDNADINVRTLDGRNTFHAMGGILCTTPHDSVSVQNELPRKFDVSSGTFATTPILSYYKPSQFNLRSKTVLKLDSISPKDLEIYQKVDSIYLSSLYFNLRIESWGGFMAHHYNKKIDGFFTTNVLPVPFINLDPGNLRTIYTALRFALEQVKKIGGSTCIVTFDQPLYAKAIKIVNSAVETDPISKVFVRLGGFHLLMSFLGTIGYLMSGSGLEDVLEVVYAKNSIVHILNGHAYERAIRAHFLIHMVLTKLILQVADLKNDVERKVLSFLQNFDQSKIHETPADELMDAIQDRFESLSDSSDTCALWLQYWKQINIVKYYIRAERLGDFDLQLYSIKCMLPYFHAAGHLAYAKYAHFYLQDALKLESYMTPGELKKFKEDAMFTIRRTKMFWSGTWSDMVIEQNLMRQIKTRGGLCQGRGTSDKALQKWICSIPYCCQIGDRIDEFCGIKRSTISQHKDLSESRKQRDHRDQDLLMEFFEDHNPFKVGDEKSLHSISSGIVVGKEVNCYNAESHGKAIMSKLVGQNFEDMKLKRNDKVKTMNPHTIKIRDEIVVVDPRQLFNRIMCTATSPEQLQQCFEFELSTEATSMFENFFMRKTKKSSLFEIMDKHLKDIPLVTPVGRQIYFIDGGFLLHKVVWEPSKTYQQIYESNAQFIEFHYGRRCHIIFDGYSERLSTKHHEQQRRAGSTACVDILFEDSMVPTVAQSRFLTNAKNKSRFIGRLSSLLIARGHSVTQSEGDADTSIVRTALPLFQSENSHVVVSEDIDILILLLHHCESSNVFMLRSFGLHKIIPIKTLQEVLGSITVDLLFFVHAVSGGDKTSALKGKGKASALKIIQKNKELVEKLNIFYVANADRTQLCNIGELFVLCLYNTPKDITCINKLRYFKFNQINARKSLTKEMDIALLPPTKNALNQHIFRVYHQVQEWCGNSLNPLEWGWVMKGNSMIPNQGVVEVAPRFVLDLIFCNCKKSSCQSLCSCRKFGIKCTAQCGHCCGLFCTNKIDEEEDSETEE